MNIIVDSTFNPFNLNDLLAPIDRYNEAYDKLEAEYSDLVTQTEAWKDIANRENSPEAYAMYKSYSDQLNAIVDDFSQGMNPRNRRQLLGMKRRYASDIIPIARASEAMQAANALRDQASPDAIFEEGRYTSLDRFLHGQTANNKFESRKDIVARTAALAQATAQSILEDPIIRNSMSPQFLEVIQKRGLGSLEELQAAIAGNPAATNRFAQIKSQMIDQLGGLDRFDQEGQRAIDSAINEGLYTGLNNYQISLQNSGEYLSKAQRLSEDRANRQESRSLGKEPIGVDKDGNEIYVNQLGEAWKATKKGIKEVKLPSNEKKSDKPLSSPIQIVGLRRVATGSTGNQSSSFVFSPQKKISSKNVEGAQLVRGGYDGLTFDEQAFFEQEYPQLLNNLDNLSFYYKYAQQDEDGDWVEVPIPTDDIRNSKPDRHGMLADGITKRILIVDNK